MKALLVGMCICVGSAGAQDERPVIFEADFDGENALDGWGGNAGEVTEGYEGTPSLVIEQTAADGSAVRTRPVPIEEMAGKLVTLKASVKAEGVGDRPQPWNGVKVMLVIDLPGGKQHPQLLLDVGTYDWRIVTRTLRVPRAATGATLTLGLELVTGKAWFDAITIAPGRPFAGGRRSETMDRGHELPRLRGAMHGPNFREEDFRALATDFGANHMRWQLNWVPMKEAEVWAKDVEEYRKWLDGALENCDKAVDLAEELNVVLLVDLHCPPGGRVEGGKCLLFQEQRYQDLFLESWRKIATRYKGRRPVWAYDLVNEPVEGHVAEGLMNWRDLATAAAKVIREIEPGKPVLVEPGPWGGPGGFDSFEPLDLDAVIYSCHMYLPHNFTHQGVHNKETGIAYPGEISGEQWDKERLREALAPARDFQTEFNVAMYIGEFSAIRWAPDNSAYRYLRDVIEICEEYEWDWAYHAFREWSGWSVEHGTDPDNSDRSATPTEREKLLRSHFAKNERPDW